jgi:LacI family transcriptional regulator
VTGRTNRISFWVPEMEGQYFHELTCRFHRLLRQDHYEMIMGEFDWDMSDPSQSVGFTRMDVDGVLIFGGALGEKLRMVLETNFPAKAPIVNMGLQCEGNLDYVRLDFYSAARDAVASMIKLGRRRIAYLYREDPKVALQERYRAYMDEIRTAGLEPILIPYADKDKATVRQTIKEFVGKHGCPDGIFCISYDCVLATLKGLRDLGKKNPEDVMLVCSDGIEELEYLDTPISVIIPPTQEMCSLAWEFLRRRMKDPEIGQQKAVLKANFVLRGSR